MKNIAKDFIAAYSIVCPYCKFKQTGIVRIYNLDTEILLTVDVYNSFPPLMIIQPAIKCCMDKLNGADHCGRLIAGDLLEEVTRTAVKSPSSFKS